MNDLENSEFGYHFYPSKQVHDLGHPRLDVLLASAPSGKHFDPERVDFPVVVRQDEIQTLAVEHPWTMLNGYRVTAGRIILRDLRGKVHEAFSYGGELKIETNDARTRCNYTSPAPILNLDFEDSTANLLAQETEILLAERRAAWAHNPAVFEIRLANLDPSKLFAACLLGLRDKFKRLPRSEDPETIHLVHHLKVDSEALGRRGLSTLGFTLKDLL